MTKAKLVFYRKGAKTQRRKEKIKIKKETADFTDYTELKTAAWVNEKQFTHPTSLFDSLREVA